MKLDTKALLKEALEGLKKQVNAELQRAGLTTSKAEISGTGNNLKLQIKGPDRDKEKAEAVLRKFAK